MIAPAALSDPRPDVDGLVAFRVDPTTEPGNAVPALARLLIDLARQQNEKEANHDTCASDTCSLS